MVQVGIALFEDLYCVVGAVGLVDGKLDFGVGSSSKGFEKSEFS